MSFPRLLERRLEQDFSPRLNHTHTLLDNLSSQVQNTLSDPYSLTALAFAPLVGKFAQGHICAGLQNLFRPAGLSAHAARGISFGAGFSVEILGYETLHRGLRVGLGGADPALLSREQFITGLKHSATQFFFLKAGAHFTQGAPILLSHFAVDAAMVAGNRLTGQSHGNLVQDFIQADLMHWQVKAGLGVFHGAMPSVAIHARALDLYASANPKPLSILPVQRNPLAGVMRSEGAPAKIPHDQIPRDKIQSMGKIPDVFCNRMLGDGNLVGLGVWSIGQERPVLIPKPGVRGEMSATQVRTQAQQSAQAKFKANPIPEKFSTAVRGLSKEGSESELKFQGSMPGLNDTIYRFRREGDALVIVHRDGAPKLRVLHEGEILKDKTMRVQDGDIVEVGGEAPFVFSTSPWTSVKVKASPVPAGTVADPFIQPLSAQQAPRHFREALSEVLSQRIGVRVVDQGVVHYTVSKRPGLETDIVKIIASIRSCPIRVKRGAEVLEADNANGLALKAGDVVKIGEEPAFIYQ